MRLSRLVKVPGSKLLSEGIYVGGSFEGAQVAMPLGGLSGWSGWSVGSQAWVEEGEGSSLRIRFFLNHIQWRQGKGY